MQTVQFQCGHCGGLMGVSDEFLGRQVRCPSCQQVVVAPAAAAPSAPEPAPAPDGNADDLFLANLQTAPIGDPPKPEPQPAVTPAPAAPATAAAPEPHPVAPAESGPAADPSLPWHDPAAHTAGPEEPVARAQRQTGGGISWLWLLPLLSYSILSTVLLVIVYLNLQTSNDTINKQNERIKKQDERINKQDEELKELRKTRGKAPD